eukprot:CAMPEP_0204352338 /NCGR_PEP_ID=MMETSP0469-20131031/31814_1 /ASSEMBLY_ACC=CAM_ASM_000384 /TAXON_ID=2969 /ORGANISM="Oxyrrhis marina" /LENGTH=66 /DNA_ID=CAMNT_0051339055 /DNA_START=108 /DNA_END=304 /DNA_ORIENTATION=-
MAGSQDMGPARGHRRRGAEAQCLDHDTGGPMECRTSEPRAGTGAGGQRPSASSMKSGGRWRALHVA